MLSEFVSRISRNFDLRRASIFLCLSVLSAACLADSKQACSDRVIASVRKAVSISAESKIRADACKRWPGDASQLLVALAVEPANYPVSTDYKLPLYVVMMKAESGTLLSKYQGSLSEDAVTAIGDDALTLDTAPYFLAKGQRAFGLRVRGYTQPQFSEGGADDYLSLYVIDRENIRPVLDDLSMVFWRVDDRVKAAGDVVKVVTTLSIAVGSTASNGYADLVISAKTSNTKRIRTHTLRYNGHQYPFDLVNLWMKLGGTK